MFDPSDLKTQPRKDPAPTLSFSQVAKARLEETDRRTANDVVENGERLEISVTFNSLDCGLST